MFQNQKLWRRAALFASLLLHLSLGVVFAQNATLRGKVSDAQTGAPLPQANVIITAAGVESGATTGDNGAFEVKSLAAGIYTVTVSHVGYEKRIIAKVEIKSDATKVLNIALTPSDILLNPVVVSASRRQEKALAAPAAISVVEASQIQRRSAMTATDYLRGVPAVDISTNGIAQSSVTVRGFNGIFTGSLLSLTDNRYAHVPSLRANVYSFIPLTNEDISRIEVVSGPGSALYGPNSANGVMHIITRSPFESEGTSLSIGGGGRDFLNLSSRVPVGGRNIYTASLRHAGRASEKVGYKISAQYFQGRDWETYSPVDVAPRQITFGRQTSSGRITQGGPVRNQADFNVEKIAAEARLDFRLSDEATLIFNGGFNQADQIELTGIGAGQARDWRYLYAQARFNYKKLFVQSFINTSDAGDTYILRTGDLIIDNSKLLVGQVQHGLSLGERQRFIYGLDAQLTRPDTKNTINGRNEDQDNINEFGVYLQSETNVSSKLDLVAAARLDDHNRIEDPTFSPRAALVFKPSTDHNLRLTYNRAFSTPSTSSLFLDILSANIANPLNPNKPLLSIRARGVSSESGFTFRRGSDNRPLMMSQLLPAGTGYVSSTVNSVWPALRQVLIAQSPANLRALLNATLPQQLSGNVPGDLRSLNTGTGQFGLVADARNVPTLKPPINNTYEFGYKGVLNKKLAVGVDVYHSRFKDLIRLGSTVESPNVFANPQQFAAALQPTAVAITNALIAQGLTPAQAQAQATAIVTGLVTSAARLPLGVVSPEQIANDTDVILTYRNFGKISVNGLDLALTYYANPNWVFSGNYSFVATHGFNLFKQPNRVFFPKADGVANVAFNAPGHKAGLGIQYRHLAKGFDAELRGRYVEGFPMESAVYAGDVQTYAVFDANLSYELSFAPDTRVTLSALNLFDKKHREFIGAPILGRLMLARVTQSL